MARVIRKLDVTEWNARKKAKADVAAASGGNESVKTRLDRLEKAVGIVPAAASK